MTLTPVDFPAAIREVKAELRARVGDVAGAFARIEDRMRAEVADVVAQRARGEEVWPVVRIEDIKAGTVPTDVVAAVRRRGCAIVRQTFPSSLARDWDRELVDYLDRNDFD